MLIAEITLRSRGLLLRQERKLITSQDQPCITSLLEHYVEVAMNNIPVTFVFVNIKVNYARLCEMY